MGQPSLDAAVARIAAIPEYQDAFREVFGGLPNARDLLRAIASYERTQLSFDSPFDRFIAGDSTAIDNAAKRGWELFNTRARCNKCHALSEQKRDATYFTDNDFHNIGIGIIRHNVVALARQAEQAIKSGDTSQIDRAAIQTDMSALGRFLITRSARDIAAFKTPSLRNVLVTGPYFHDGSQETLWDVMDHYNKGDGLQDPYLDEDIQPLALTEDDIARNHSPRQVRQQPVAARRPASTIATEGCRRRGLPDRRRGRRLREARRAPPNLPQGTVDASPDRLASLAMTTRSLSGASRRGRPSNSSTCL